MLEFSTNGGGLGLTQRYLSSQEKLHWRVVLHVPIAGGGCNACEPDAPAVSSGEVMLLVKEGKQHFLCLSNSLLAWDRYLCDRVLQ